MTLESVLQQLGLDPSCFDTISPHWLQSSQDFPNHKPFFLEQAYLRDYVPHTSMPAEALPHLEEMADIVANDTALLRLAWHAHRQLASYPDVHRFRNWPSLDEYLGHRSGLFYLLVVCSTLKQFRDKIRELNIPDSYYIDSSQRVCGFYEKYALSHQRPGMDKRQVHWMRHYLDGKLFRVGRFEYMIDTAGRYNAVVYRHRTTGETLVVNGPQHRQFNGQGHVLYSDEPPAAAAFQGATIQSGSQVHAIPCDPRGFAVDQPVVLDLNEWECVVGPADHVAGIHIPPGGNMTPRQCHESLEAMFPFFRQYLPALNIRAAYCISWIFNTDFETLLPESNLTRLMQESYLFPTPSSGKDGLYFIFGDEDRELAAYPRDNSVRRALLQVLDEGRRLRSGGMIFLEEHLPHYGRQYYRSQFRSWSHAVNT